MLELRSQYFLLKVDSKDNARRLVLSVYPKP